MSRPRQRPDRRRVWEKKAALKEAIVPEFFEVFPTRVVLVCGRCRHEFSRALVKNLNEPVFVCPQDSCNARNWVPVRFEQ